MPPSRSYRLLQIALVVFGAVMILLYPLAVVWPAGGHGITARRTSRTTS